VVADAAGKQGQGLLHFSESYEKTTCWDVWGVRCLTVARCGVILKLDTLAAGLRLLSGKLVVGCSLARWDP